MVLHNDFNIENVYKDVSHICGRSVVRDRKWEPVSFYRNYFFVVNNVENLEFFGEFQCHIPLNLS